MELNLYNSILIASLISVTGNLQAQTQQQIESILLPKLSPVCTKQTQLIFPKGSNWEIILQEFATCSAPLTIKVLSDNTLEMHEEGGVWLGKLNTKGSIEKIKDLKIKKSL